MYPAFRRRYEYSSPQSKPLPHTTMSSDADKLSTTTTLLARTRRAAYQNALSAAKLGSERHGYQGLPTEATAAASPDHRAKYLRIRSAPYSHKCVEIRLWGLIPQSS